MSNAWNFIIDSLMVCFQKFSVPCFAIIAKFIILRLEVIKAFTLFANRTLGDRLVLRHYIPELLRKFPDDLMRKVHTHSIDTFVSHVKSYLYSYACSAPNCFVCKTWYAFCASCHYDLRLNTWLRKQSRHRWFETPPRSYDVTVMI